MIAYIVVTVLLTLCHAQKTSDNINVTISLGTVTGLHVTGNIEYYSFRGIPYANATKRFKAPIPMETWKSVVVATDDAAPCAQPGVFGTEYKMLVEDCLFLNVYTPKLPQSSSGDQSKLPVMVFIYGGGFMTGGSSSLLYGPEFFMAEKNVVLVSFNYRLGIFGFLSTSSSEAQGNAGMKDQVEALRFIKHEISYFGGDPNSVTIFGESAGAASVVHHVLSPLSKGLFHRAIAESGSALCDWAHIEGSVARERATLLAKNLGCNTDNTTIIVSCLSKMSTSALCQASFNNIISIQETIEGLLTFVPVIETKFDEDVFLADYPLNVINNLTDVVPLIIGTNKDEGMMLLTDDDNNYAIVDRELQFYAPRDVIKQATEDQLNEIAQEVRAFYFNNGPVNRTTLKGYVNLNTDHTFMYPTVRTVRKLVENKNRVYLYHFAYSGGYKVTSKVATKLGYEGVDHGEEVGYFFYSNAFKNTDLSKTTTQDYTTMQKMVKLWIAFATTGVPSSPTDEVIKNIYWPEITNASELNYLEMDTSFSDSKDYYKTRTALWDRLTRLQTSSAFKTVPTTLLLTLFLILLICKLL